MLEFAEQVAHLGEEFLHLSHRIEIFHIFNFSLHKLAGYTLEFILLLRCIRIILNFALIGQSIMHGQLLLQVTDLLLVLFQQ